MSVVLLQYLASCHCLCYSSPWQFQLLYQWKSFCITFFFSGFSFNPDAINLFPPNLSVEVSISACCKKVSYGCSLSRFKCNWESIVLAYTFCLRNLVLLGFRVERAMKKKLIVMELVRSRRMAFSSTHRKARLSAHCSSLLARGFSLFIEKAVYIQKILALGCVLFSILFCWYRVPESKDAFVRGAALCILTIDNTLFQ